MFFDKNLIQLSEFSTTEPHLSQINSDNLRSTVRLEFRNQQWDVWYAESYCHTKGIIPPLSVTLITGLGEMEVPC
jgi:hypothetical protein